MADDTVVYPDPLDPKALAHSVEVLMKHMARKEGCDDLTVSVAQKMSDFRLKGTTANVRNALPKLMEIDPATGKERRAAIDIMNPDGECKPDGKLQVQEYTAVLLAAAKLAVQKGIKIEDVEINQDLVSEMKNLLPKVLGKDFCPTP